MPTSDAFLANAKKNDFEIEPAPRSARPT